MVRDSEWPSIASGLYANMDNRLSRASPHNHAVQHPEDEGFNSFMWTIKVQIWHQLFTTEKA